MCLTVHKSLLALALLLCCFISSINVDFLGGLGKEASFYPLALGFLIWMFEIVTTRVCIYVPRNKSFYALGIFLVIIVMSSLANIDDIVDLQFKGSVAFNRSVIQIGSVCLYVLLSIYAYNVLCRMNEPSIDFFMKWIKRSFVIAGIYGSFELGKMFHIPYCSEIVYFFDSIFRGDLVWGGRIRLVTGEPSLLGLYIGMVLPCFMFNLTTGETLRRWLNALIVILLLVFTYYSFSRTAYVIIFFELIVFFFVFRQYIICKRIVAFGIVIILMAMMLFLAFFKEGELSATFFSVLSSMTSIEGTGYSVSNMSRLGSQLAACYMWLDHPLLGVGYGMYAFYAFDYFPDWGWKSPEVLVWAINDPNTMWPPSHGLYARLLAETGLLGLLSYIFIYVFLIQRIYCSTSRMIRGRSLAACAYIWLGVFCWFGFSTDGLRYLTFWILVATIWNMQITQQSCMNIVENIDEIVDKSVGVKSEDNLYEQ